MKKKTTKGKSKSVVNESECIQASIINDLQSQIEQLKNEVKMLREASNPDNQKEVVVEPIVVKQLPLENFKFTAKNLVDYVIKTLIFNQFEWITDRHETKPIDIYQKTLDIVKSKYRYFVLEINALKDDHYSVQVVACNKRPIKGPDCNTIEGTDWRYDGLEYDSMEPELVIPSELIDLDECANTIIKLDDDCVFVEVQ